MSSLWEKSALLDGDRLLIACGNEVFCILLPSLELLWHTQVDMATCFQIVAYQEDYITHGEVEIVRLNKQGEMPLAVQWEGYFCVAYRAHSLLYAHLQRH